MSLACKGHLYDRDDSGRLVFLLFLDLSSEPACPHLCNAKTKPHTWKLIKELNGEDTCYQACTKKLPFILSVGDKFTSRQFDGCFYLSALLYSQKHTGNQTLNSVPYT